MGNRKRVLVAMSGGVDSSTAAMMLLDQGYDLVGITMKTYDYTSSGGLKKETGCCSLDSINDARAVAVKFGFPHYVLDLRDEFERKIISNFVSEYLSGRTPNPCVICNSLMKWEYLLRKADQLGCDCIATGHYARVRQENGRWVLSRGTDASKDQSYVLWGLSQKDLERTIFPLGGLTKNEVRERAAQYGFTRIAGKPESYEICFIPDDDYRGFIRRRVPGGDQQFPEGNFVSKDGKVLGKHEGYPFYTIGQRKGLKIALGEPMFVSNIIPSTNTVVIGPREELFTEQMKVIRPNLVKYEELSAGLKVVTKIRYRDTGTESMLTEDGGNLLVHFLKPVAAVTPGQSAVFYEGDDVVGGGIIDQ